MKKEISINMFFTLTIGLLGFILNRVFADTMGASDLGLMRLFTQLVSYFTIVDLGLTSASTYALYKPIVEKKNEEINNICSTIDNFYKKISLSIIILGFFSLFFLKKIVGDNNYGIWLYIYWIMYVMNTSISYLFAKHTVVFTANQEYVYVRKIQGTSKLLVNLLQIFLLLITKSFLIYIILMISQNLISLYFYKRYYNKNYSYIKKTNVKEKGIIKDMKNLFWHKIAGMVVYNTDYLLLASFVSLKVIGIYSSYLMVYSVVLMLVGIITPVIRPKIGKFIAINYKDTNRVYELWENLNLIYMIFGSTFITVSYFMLNPFIKLWMGKDYILPKITVILILINLYIQISRIMIDVFKENSGFYDDIYTPISEALINLIVSLVLVKKIGLNGVIIGTVSSNLFIVYLLKPILVFERCFKKTFINYIITASKYVFIFLIIFYLVSRRFDSYKISEISNWKEWIKYSFNITFFTLLMSSLCYFLDGVFIRNLKALKKFF